MWESPHSRARRWLVRRSAAILGAVLRLPPTLLAALVAVSALTGCLLLNPLAELTPDRESDGGNADATPADAGPRPARPRPTAVNPHAEDAAPGAAGEQTGSELDAGPPATADAMAPTRPGPSPAEGGGGGLGGTAGATGAEGGGAGSEPGSGGASPVDPAEVAPIAQVAAGSGLTCVVRTDQEIDCWGRNDVGQAEPPEGAYGAVAITADGTAACGLLADGALVCWGDDRFSEVPAGEFVDVALASDAACAIRSDGVLACWGSLGFGLNGVPTGSFTDVSMRAEYACAIRDDQTLSCWGGDGHMDPAPDGTFVSVDTGNVHHCAVSTDGSLVCWGANTAGQTSPPAEAFAASASLGSAADGPVSCGVTVTGAVTCWGTEAERIVERQEGSFTQLAMSATHLCALTAAGELQCWTEPGAGNEYGQASPPWTNVRQLAVGSTTLSIINRVMPSICAVFEDDRVECIGDAALAAGVPFDRVREIAIGSGYACATALDGTLACWGLTEVVNLPTATDLFSITLGFGSHGCALRPDDTLACWGFANAIEGTFRALDYGGNLFVAVRTDGPLEIWDDGVFGSEPLPVFPFGTYRAASVGPASTCAIDDMDGAATCIRNRAEDPLPVLPEGEWLSIDLQEGSSCGLRPDGTIECWQGNRQHDLPTEHFAEFTERLEFGCGRRADKSVSCWGELHR